MAKLVAPCWFSAAWGRSLLAEAMIRTIPAAAPHAVDLAKALPAVGVLA